MQLDVRKEGDIFRLVYTGGGKGAVTLGRRHPNRHSALRTRERYLRPENHEKLMARVASARGEIKRVRIIGHVPTEKEAANG